MIIIICICIALYKVLKPVELCKDWGDGISSAVMCVE